MQIMRFVVFFIQEYLYSNILANSIFYSVVANKTFCFQFTTKNSEYLILQVLGSSECLILHILVKVSVLHGSTM